jgi:hypothetical protein
MPAAGVVAMQTGLTRIACLLAGVHGKKDAGSHACGNIAFGLLDSKQWRRGKNPPVRLEVSTLKIASRWS